jgi:hypothetical protein
MFLHFYSNRDFLRTFEINDFKQWEQIEINVGEGVKTIFELLSNTKEVSLISEYNEFGNKERYSLHENHLKILMGRQSSISDITRFLLSRVKYYFKSFQSIVDHENNSRNLVLSKNESSCPIPKEELLKIIRHHKNNNYDSARVIVPCLDNYPSLRIKNESHQFYVDNYFFDDNFRYVKLPYPKMVSPFIRQEINRNNCVLNKVVNANLIDWVYENRFDNNTTKKQIEEAYEKFCAIFDLDEINKIPTESEF